MDNLTPILNLPTPRLLAYFKKHYRDRRGSMEKAAGEYGHLTAEDLANFMEKYDLLKIELAARENIDTKHDK